MGLLSLYFQPSGRIGRLKFWLGWLGLLLVEAAFTYWLVTAVFGRDPLDILTNSLSKPALQLTLLINAIFAFPYFTILAKRFHDRGKGALWTLPYLGAFLALIGSLTLSGGASPTGSPIMIGVAAFAMAVVVWTIVELGFLRGTTGGNRYGRDPLVKV
jgi:uncharacterized membrane protein YhaH (DUF805 family)